MIHIFRRLDFHPGPQWSRLAQLNMQQTTSCLICGEQIYSPVFVASSILFKPPAGAQCFDESFTCLEGGNSKVASRWRNKYLSEGAVTNLGEE